MVEEEIVGALLLGVKLLPLVAFNHCSGRDIIMYPGLYVGAMLSTNVEQIHKSHKSFAPSWSWWEWDMWEGTYASESADVTDAIDVV